MVVVQQETKETQTLSSLKIKKNKNNPKLMLNF